MDNMKAQGGEGLITHGIMILSIVLLAGHFILPAFGVSASALATEVTIAYVCLWIGLFLELLHSGLHPIGSLIICSIMTVVTVVVLSLA